MASGCAERAPHDHERHIFFVLRGGVDGIRFRLDDINVDYVFAVDAPLKWRSAVLCRVAGSERSETTYFRAHMHQGPEIMRWCAVPQ